MMITDDIPLRMIETVMLTKRGKLRTCTILCMIHKLLMIAFVFCLLSQPAICAGASPAYRLLILDSQFGHPYDQVRASLLAHLEKSGFHQGQELDVRVLSAENDVAKGMKILRREVKHHYNVIFVGGTVATIAAKRVLYGSKQPVVFGSPTDPVGIGVIDNFTAPPKANFTGVSYPVPVKARLRFIHKLLPHAHRIGLIYADMPQSHSYNRWLRELLADDPEFKDMKILFSPVPLITGEHGDQAMAKAAIPLIHQINDQVDVFIKPNDQLGTREALARVMWQEATKPLIGLVRDDVMAGWGATAVIYPSHKSIGQQAASMIEKLFRGQAIATIPPSWPASYGYAVDLRKSNHFHIAVPIGLLQLAGHNIIKP